MTDQALAALVLGITAGLQPGPLSAVVVREAVHKGFAAGAKASLAPIATDLPMVLLVLAVFRSLRDYTAALGILSLLGAAYCCWLAWETWSLAPLRTTSATPSDGSLTRAVTVNLLNPHPYLFWFTVGGAYLTGGGILPAVVFVSVFLSAVVSTKVVIAWLASRTLRPGGARAQRWVNRVLALLLSMVAAQLLLVGLVWLKG
ncbi:MAG: LysE family translocator [Chromatiales bacterium]